MIHDLQPVPWVLLGAAGGTLLGFVGALATAMCADARRDPQWDDREPCVAVLGARVRIDYW